MQPVLQPVLPAIGLRTGGRAGSSAGVECAATQYVLPVMVSDEI
jgi:hypothetical protein